MKVNANLLVSTNCLDVKMLLILSVCVASLATYSTTLPLESGPEDIRISQDLADLADPDRLKRSTSLKAIGALAFRQLVTGARPAHSRAMRTFYKDGGYFRALQDFYSVNPQHVTDGVSKRGETLYGHVGDRVLMLRKDGLGGRPTLEIKDTNEMRADASYSIDRIVYVKPTKE